ncbi:MAG TPA: SRPBCC domain-containing protein [Thermoanaerobaculia bacterium]|nr:SRPBCC domain-containing protein [Thermoanaerobaculia bacterium]
MIHTALALSLALMLADQAPAATPTPSPIPTPTPTVTMQRTPAPAASPTPEGAGATTMAGPVVVTKAMSPEKALRFEVTIPAPVADVWTALSTAEGLETWLWRDARVDLRPGGDWLVVYPGNRTGGGTVVSFEPQKRLELHAMAPEQFPEVRSVGTKVVFELEPMSATSTRLTMTQTGWREGRQWDEAYDYLATGNAQLLVRLHQRFVSGPRSFPAVKP